MASAARQAEGRHRGAVVNCRTGAQHRLYEVQACLGHSDPKVTQRYAHLSTKSLQDAANSASIMIRGTVPVAIPMELPLLLDVANFESVEMAVAA